MLTDLPSPETIVEIETEKDTAKDAGRGPPTIAPLVTSKTRTLQVAITELVKERIGIPEIRDEMTEVGTEIEVIETETA